MTKPTQEQVIQWAREADAYEGDDPANANERIWVMNDEELQKATTFAYEAGRKDENEACAELIPPQYFELRDRIRARREQ